MAKWHFTNKGRTKIHQEKANFVPISNTDCEQSAEAINVKPTPGTAPVMERASLSVRKGVKLGIFC